MYSPNPILLAPTPEDGLILPIDAGQGGLAGYILLGQSGPPSTIDIRASEADPWLAVTYPHTLQVGEDLRLIRTDTSPQLTTLRALAPVDEGGVVDPGVQPFTVTTDAGGYQTITEADVITDASGYQTITDATATTDPDGYESVERMP